MIAGNVFTPYLRAGSDERWELLISDGDLAKIKRGCAWQAEVTDIQSGRRFLVRDADCSIPHCHCAAVVLRELPRLVS